MHAGRDENQRIDMQHIFSDFDSFGKLDYVTCWFWKGAHFIRGSKAELALVATNSICQEQQVSHFGLQYLRLIEHTRRVSDVCLGQQCS